MQEKFDTGWWPGHAPLGYKNKTVNDKKIIVPDPASLGFSKKRPQNVYDRELFGHRDSRLSL